MSARAARAVALPFALLAVALRLAVGFRVEPWTWHLGTAAGLVAGSVAWLAGGALPLVGYLLVTRRARRRPAAFGIDERRRRFTATATPRWNGPWIVVLGWLAANAIILEPVPGRDSMRLAAASVPAVAGLVCAGVLLALIAVAALSGRPWLALTPAGMTDQRRLRRKEVTWDELVPGGPQPPGTRDPATLDVYLWSAATAGSFARRHLPARDWHVDPAFLAHAIRTYAEHRDRRPGIGTAAELTRLQETFDPEA